MNRKTVGLLSLLILIAVGLSACGRREPEPPPIRLVPTFTPTPVAPIVIHVSSDRPGGPIPMPDAPRAIPQPIQIQLDSPIETPTPEASQIASGSLVAQSSTASVQNSGVDGATTSAGRPGVVVAAQSEPATGQAPDVAQSNVAQQEPVVAAASSNMQAAPSGPGGLAPELAAIAAELGVTEEALLGAMGDEDQGPPDFAAIAAELSVSEEALMAAFGDPPSGGRPAGGPPSSAP